MYFLSLFREEMRTSLAKMGAMSCLGGASNAVILSSVNAGAQASAAGHVSLYSAAAFLVALIVYIQTQHYLMTVSNAEIEAIIHKLRLRLLDQARKSELVQLDDIGRAAIVSVITKETAALGQVTPVLALSAQAVVLIFFVSLYIAWLSLFAFALSVTIVGLSASLYIVRNRRFAAQRREAFRWESEFFERMSDLLNGFKEIKLNRNRSDELFAHIDDVSRNAANIKIRTQTDTLKQAVFSQTSFYVLLAALTFVVPAFDSTAGASVVKTTTAVLFAIGACWGIVQSVPILSAANAAAENIQTLSARLAETTRDAAAEPASFAAIHMRGVTFRYVDKHSQNAFQIGPIDLDLHPGDLVFITGGNGSGKSTFLRLLATLYQQDAGTFTLNGQPVEGAMRESYRTLVAAIFSDYHLFLHAYGISDPDPRMTSELLAEFGLADKTGLSDGTFRTLDLSAGQRKRLALVVALLEGRPILLLDEWTADQDPEYREKFYKILVPMLHRAGKTIVAVTHDEGYLETLPVRARRLRMVDGVMVEQVASAEGF